MAMKKDINQLRTHNVSLVKEVSELLERVRNMEQCTNRNNVEVSGIPVIPKENVMDIGRGLGVSLEVGTTQADISVAHRVLSVKKKRLLSIVIQFQCRATRD